MLLKKEFGAKNFQRNLDIWFAVQTSLDVNGNQGKHSMNINKTRFSQFLSLDGVY